MELNKELNHAPENIHHIHIMGVCGTGMAALAGMLKSAGFEIRSEERRVGKEC